MMKEVDKYKETAAARGQPMNDTRDGWKYLADIYADLIMQQKEEITKLKKINEKAKAKHFKYVKRIIQLNPLSFVF
jgi:hypothetical protein